MFCNSNCKESVPSLCNNDTLFTDDFDKANLLNNYFCNQAVLNVDNVQTPVLSAVHESTLSSFTLCPLEVKHILETLGKAIGPNKINNRVKRELLTDWSIPLCSLFSHSLRECSVPVTWKEAHVCPIFKSDNPSIVSNHRSIALLCTIEKAFE